MIFIITTASSVVGVINRTKKRKKVQRKPKPIRQKKIVSIGILCDNGRNVLSKKVLDWLSVQFEITLQSLAEESKMSFFKKKN